MDESKLTIASAGTDSRPGLALVRTELANERTFMAYLRTCLMFAATAVTLHKFFPNTPNILWASLSLAGVAAIIGLAGIYRFFSLRQRLKAIT